MAYDFTGTHVISDVYDIPDHNIRDNDLIMRALETGIAKSGATICGVQVKNFDPSGLTAVFLLSESHVAVHTYPDARSLFIDTFTCGTACRPQTVIDTIVEILCPGGHRTSVIQRGLPMAGIPAGPPIPDQRPELAKI